MIVFGITGGTGSGKTSLLSVLEKFDAYTIDCDARYYEMLQPGSEMYRDICDVFGDVFDENGILDRKKLGERVFCNETELAKLNAITLKHFQKEIADCVEEQRAIGRRITAIDGINVIQARNAKQIECDCMVGIVSPVEERIRRIMARDHITREYALKRINAQQPDSFYYDNCDVVVNNDSHSMEEFEEKMKRFLEELISRMEEYKA